MGCCGDTDNSERPAVTRTTPGIQLSKRVVGLTERTMRTRACMSCPNRVKSGDKAGVNKRDYCDWDKKKIREKVKDSMESCPKLIWPVFEPGQEPRDEVGALSKMNMLLSSGADIVSGAFVEPEVMESRRSHCLTCIYRIPKHSDGQYDPNVILETDICGICTCPVLSITKLKSKMCPDNPSKWGQVVS